MRIFERGAEQHLFEKAKTLAGDHTGWRGILLNFSHVGLQRRDRLNKVVAHLIRDQLGIEAGYVYLCGVDRVIILFEGKTSTIVDKLTAIFQDLTIEEGQNLLTLYDLSLESSWKAFYALCELVLDESIAEEPAAAPAAKPLREFDAALFERSREARTHDKLRVLVVEDDAFTRRLVSGTLKGQYDLVEAANGEAAVDAYESYAPDAVFLDIELPDTNGHVLLKKILAFDPHAFVVMLSANSFRDNILRALEEGAQGFVTKPFARDKLVHYLTLCRQAHSHLA